MCIRIVDFERKQTQSLIKKSIQEITRINNRIILLYIKGQYILNQVTGTSSVSSSNANFERTQVLYGPENTTSAILKFLLDVETKLDICADST